MARTFNGTSDVANAGTITELHGLGVATFSVWACRTNTAHTVGMGNTDGSTTTGSRWSFLWFSDGNIYASCHDGGAAFVFCALAGTGWHNITLLFNGSEANADRCKIFIDGVVQATSSSGTLATAMGATSTWTFGKDASNRFTGGILAESGLWNTNLSTAEIGALARVNPRRVRPQSLIGYWPLWGIHSPEIDLTRFARPASLTGTGKNASHAPVPPYLRMVTMPTEVQVAATATSSGGVGISTFKGTTPSSFACVI